MIHVITGPPCAGKSTYVAEHAQKGDLRIDYDMIAQALGAPDSHSAAGVIKQAAFDAREGAIEAALKDPDEESWIIHTSPSKKHMERYKEAEADFINLDPGKEVCIERAENDNRPEQTFIGIEKWYEKKGGKKRMGKKIKRMFAIKASENGKIAGYASTFTKTPDSYGDIVAPGAFKECIEKIKAEGKVLPLLFNHNSDDLGAYIGTVYDLEEDEHGLKFDAAFDDTPEGQKARSLALNGRVCKFSFAYDVLDWAMVKTESGEEARELRKLDIHEVSLVMYPANEDTSVIEVKSGRRNSAKDEEDLKTLKDIAKQIITIVDGLMSDDINDGDDSSKAKSKEPDAANDEEQKKKEALLKAEEILKKGF